MKTPPLQRLLISIFGLVMIVGAGFGVIYAGKFLNPPPLRIAVARVDLGVGERVKRDDFLIVPQVIDPALARLYVQESDAANIEGTYVVDQIRKGDPLNKVKLTSNQPAAGISQSRYALALQDTDHVIMGLKVNADALPPLLTRGDFVNIIFAGGPDVGIGRLPDDKLNGRASVSMTLSAQQAGKPAEPPVNIDAQTSISASLDGKRMSLPFSTLLLEAVPVMDVIFDGATAAQTDPSDPKPAEPGKLSHIVVKVPRVYQNILAFAAATSRLQYALVSPLAKDQKRRPEMVVDWNSVVELVRWQSQQVDWRGETMTHTLYPAYEALGGPVDPTVLAESQSPTRTLASTITMTNPVSSTSLVSPSQQMPVLTVTVSAPVQPPPAATPAN